MSKELEALNYLVNLAVVGNKEKHRGKIFDSEEIVLEALKRNEPMKVDSSGYYSGLGYSKCPVCNHYNLLTANYCSECGQALDWRKENE